MFFLFILSKYLLLTIGIRDQFESWPPIPLIPTLPRLQRSRGAMEPNLKLVLEEIQKSKEEFGRRFDEHNKQWERRFAYLKLSRAAHDAAVDKRLDSIELAGADTAYTIGRRIADLEAVRIDPLQDERDDCVTALEVAATDLGTWRPEMEALVDDLRIEMQKLSQGREPMVFDVLPQWPNVVASSSSAPSGHGDASSHRDGGFGTGAV